MKKISFAEFMVKCFVVFAPIALIIEWLPEAWAHKTMLAIWFIPGIVFMIGTPILIIITLFAVLRSPRF